MKGGRNINIATDTESVISSKCFVEQYGTFGSVNKISVITIPFMPLFLASINPSQVM